MIHVVDGRNKHLYAEELNDLFRARKQVFVDGFGWNLPLSNGLEIDQFDDEHTIYTIGFDTCHNVVMSIRFRPTDDKSLVGDLFAHALPVMDRPITDGKTWEVTRGFCLEFGRRPWNLKRKAACMTAPFELMLATGRDRLVGFTDVRMLSFLTNMGWRLRPLADAIEYGEGNGFAFDIEVTHEALSELRNRWGLPAQAYVRLEKLEKGQSVHDAARQAASEQNLEDMLPRDDLSRLRRRSPASIFPPAPRRPLGERRAAA